MLKPIKTLAILGAVLLSLFAMALYAAADLNYFLGEWNGDQVTLYWETGTEIDHAAFHLWRSTENLEIENFQIDKDQAERLTDQVILNPDQNPCTAQGYQYEFVDDTVNRNEEVYYYYLETFDCNNGASEFQGSLNTIGGLEVQNPGPSSATPTRRATATPFATRTAIPTRTGTPSITRTPSPFSRLYLPIIMRLTPTDYYSFEASETFYLPNCNLTQVKGIIWDGESNSRLNGVTVRVWYDGAAFHEFYSPPSGSPPRKPGEWEITLATYPKGGRWYVQVVDRETGDALSPKQTVYTDSRWCESGQSGRQVVIQDFVKHAEGSGVPISTTSTPTPFNTPRPTSTWWITPTPWSSTATPSVTRTATNTPTVTPTPTPRPIVEINNTDLVIPDGLPEGITSTIEIEDNVIIRDIRVHISITHTEVSDLDINLIHPDGTIISLHSEGEDEGDNEIRQWFDSHNSDIEQLRGKRSQLGDEIDQRTWTLQVIDRLEDEIGILLSWQIEIYP